MTESRTQGDRRERAEGLFFRTVGIAIRFVMLAAVLATFALAVALLAYGMVETWEVIYAIARGSLAGRDTAMLHAIEVVDTFLVAMVVLVVSIGIYQLFINHRIPVPSWLRIDDLDDLKAKLIGVVVTVLGVSFLGAALAWNGTTAILSLGIAVAAVILALTVFLGVHFRHQGGSRKGDEPDPMP